jgi:transcriptional regulator with GAF, ATPase, and Fis domain
MSPRAPHDPDGEWFDGPTALTARAEGLRAPEPIAVPRILVVVRDTDGERHVQHSGDVCRIGSHPSNDVVVRDRTVSRFHCRIVRDGAVWRVSDAGSSNGTKLEGVKVRDAELGTRATLNLGDATIVVTALADEEHAPPVAAFGSLVGASPAMQRLKLVVERVAASSANVLLWGESGTGKELVASEIVARGARAGRPYVVVDCGSLAANLVESDLFGHVRGAFTSADRDRVGAFEAADGGTVLLDEIGELPLDLQPKLLRLLESGEVRRVGETRPRRVDVRVIAATHRDLEREVNRGRFREDLYFRLSVIQVTVPPLRERHGDVPLLVRHFLDERGAPELEPALFPPSVLASLADYDWPGNVRELKNHVERATVLRDATAPRRRISGTRASVRATPAMGVHIEEPRPAAPLASFRVAKERAVHEFERAYLADLLRSTGGNVSEAARRAGMDRMHLHHLLQKHGLRT